MSVAAGSSVGFKASPNIFHPGPLQFYMAKVPAGQTAASWDGSGNVWFKIYAEKATASGGQLSWGSLSMWYFIFCVWVVLTYGVDKGTVSVTIPRATPSGDYLLRVEHIALHQASSVSLCFTFSR